MTLPRGMEPRVAVRHVLGPTAARLDMRFPSEGAYRDFGGAHPAFTGAKTRCSTPTSPTTWSVNHPRCGRATTFATVEADSIDQNAGVASAGALETPAPPDAADRG